MFSVYFIFIPGIVVWGFVIPTFIYLFLKESNNSGTNQTNKVQTFSKNKLGAKRLSDALRRGDLFLFLSEGYKKRYFYWELMNFLRKFILTFLVSVNQFLSNEEKNIFLALLFLVYFIMLLKIKPYVIDDLNKLEITGYGASFVTIFCMVLLELDHSYSFKLVISIIFIATNFSVFCIIIFFGFQRGIHTKIKSMLSLSLRSLGKKNQTAKK